MHEYDEIDQGKYVCFIDEEGYTPRYITYNTIIGGNGKFMRLSRPLTRYLGIDETVFLTGINDLYCHLRKSKKNKPKEGEIFYNAGKFENECGLSRARQNTVINNLSKCYLLKDNGRAAQNMRKLKLNLIGMCYFAELCYLLAKVDYDGKPLPKTMGKSRKLRKLVFSHVKKSVAGKPLVDEFPNDKYHSFVRDVFDYLGITVE